MKKICGFALSLILAVGGQAVWADDITGQDQFICSIGDVTMCNLDWDCEIGSPYQFNIPDFIVFDLETGLIKTTEASHENRQTPILSVAREDGVLVLQGLEMGRAFSFNIDELSGVLTAAAAKAGQFSGAFGVCTPIEGAAKAGDK